MCVTCVMYVKLAICVTLVMYVTQVMWCHIMCVMLVMCHIVICIICEMYYMCNV